MYEKIEFLKHHSYIKIFPGQESISFETLSENMIQLTGKLEEFLRKVKVDLENLRTKSKSIF